MSDHTVVAVSAPWPPSEGLAPPASRRSSRWREMRACNDHACGASTGHNSHDRLWDLTVLIAATGPLCVPPVVYHPWERGNNT